MMRVLCSFRRGIPTIIVRIRKVTPIVITVLIIISILQVIMINWSTMMIMMMTMLIYFMKNIEMYIFIFNIL